MWFLSRNSKNNNIIYAAYTDAGSRAGVNQDAMFTLRRNDFSLFCITDGMGGHFRGELASSEIVNTVKNWTEQVSEPYSGTSAELFDEFEALITDVNSKIYKKFNIGNVCGATIVVLLFHKDAYCVISAGDSRAYKNSDEEQEMLQITRDDIWKNQTGTADNVSLNEKLIKAVGVKDFLICNRFAGKYKPGDEFFLCSDGIYKVLGDSYIRNLPKTLKTARTDDEIMKVLETIHDLVTAKGAPDNNTGILIKCINN